MNDTIPEIEKIQIQMLRSATISKRIARARSLSSTVIKLSRRAIHRTNPSLSDQEIKEEFISLHYGRKLAEEVKKSIKDKNSQ